MNLLFFNSYFDNTHNNININVVNNKKKNNINIGEPDLKFINNYNGQLLYFLKNNILNLTLDNLLFLNNNYANIYEYIIDKNIILFNENKQKFLSKKTIIIINPSNKICGIDTYCNNLIMLFINNKIKYNILYLKNGVNNLNNLNKFKKYIAKCFNDLYEFKNNIIFIVPDIYSTLEFIIDGFNIITILHCSKILTQYIHIDNINYSNNDIIDICHAEYNSISKSTHIISPSYFHYIKQNDIYYKTIGKNIEKNKISNMYNCVNNIFINDTNILLFINRKYDLLFIGRNDKIKNIDSLLNINNHKILIITTSKLNDICNNNITIHIDINNLVGRIKKYNIIFECKCMIDLSYYHSFSYVLFEAIRNRQFMILRNLDVYDELLPTYIKQYILFLDNNDINITNLLNEKISNYIKYINSIDIHFFKKMSCDYDKFLIYINEKNFKYYSGVFNFIFS
jgi:hypothetical protein